jgi:hypothetical protein
MNRKQAIIILSLIILIPILFIGCAGMTPAQKGAVGGGAVGAVGGAIIGGNASSALIGAGVGALGGALLNDAQHSKKK